MRLEQSSLPIKTKVASWCLIVVSALATILGAVLIPVNLRAGYGEDSPISAPVAIAIFVLSLLLPGVLNIISGTMLFRRKTWAWSLSTALLSAESILCLVAFFVVLSSEGPSIAAIFICALALYLVPLLLIILDRNKFREAAERWRLSKTEHK